MPHIDPNRLDRAQGCLLGQLAGDTLGGLVEFSRPEATRTKFPAGVREMTSGGTWQNLAGQPTDDSELALSLARTLVKTRRYRQAEVLESYLAWWKHAWDRGSTISQALRSASVGTTPAAKVENARYGASQISQANGSLMRCSPLGIFGSSRPHLAVRWAKLDSELTHPNAVCVASCAAYIAGIVAGVNGADKYEVLKAALEQARKERVPSVIDALEKAKTRGPADYVSQMGWVLIALQNAFYRLLRAKNVEDGIAATIAQGGDTDTNAAIAGALLGAVHGRRGIPDRWIKTLQACRPKNGSGTLHPMPETYWPCDVLELAEQLLEAGPIEKEEAVDEPRAEPPAVHEEPLPVEGEQGRRKGAYKH